ncbi:MAG TPA: type VI secretion system tip protein VgrG, partial [Flavitalea sp.]|nr:type VI secretion system tip protein VgrG [Flavitalea sp.]
MPSSPYTNLEDPMVSVQLKLDGRDMSGEYGIRSIDINHAVNKISYAEVVLVARVEGGVDKINASDLDLFNPGVKIEILSGYGNSPARLFKGIIVRHSLELSIDSGFTLRLICKNEAIKMTYTERERYFLQQTDSAIVNKIVADYGLQCTVSTTTEKYEHMYQGMATDWDFIVSRASFNGLIITMDREDRITIKAPEVSGSSVLKIEAGADIISFDGTLNAENQPSGVSVSAWDSKTLRFIKSTAAEPKMNAQGNISAKSLSSKLQQGELNMKSTTPMTSSELKIWANGILLRERLAAITGKVTFTGNATVKTGDIITIAGVGAKFNGDAFVTGVSHTIDSGTWRTTASFGLEKNQVCQIAGFSHTEATTQLSQGQSIHLGLVTKLEGDPSGSYRVQVEVPSPAGTPASVWARISNFYATNNAGAFFLPEVGNEVVLGFVNNDPRHPVILGSLHNGKNAPPYTANSKNNIKAIVTRSRMKVEFDD